MKNTEPIYTGESSYKITATEHMDFLIHFQKSMLLSLVNRKLLTPEQMERIVTKLEK